jgi:2,3-bisphosphoglycerate-independent phosphoglycerate mutase
MAAHPIKLEKKESVIVDWRMGKMSQKDIADKHKISKGAVNAICKGIEQDGQAFVTAGVEYKQILAAQDDRMMTAVTDEVEQRTKYIAYFNRRALENVEAAFNLPVDNQNDVKARAETITKARIDVLGKPPETAIQINNNTTYREMSNEELYEIARKGR